MTTTYELYTNENGTPKAVEGKAPAIIERVEALEEKSDDYLPLSGGTMTGAIVSSSNHSLVGASSSSKHIICGGTNWADGSHIILGGKDSDYDGALELVAKNGGNEYRLYCSPTGRLQWNDKDVFTGAGGMISGKMYLREELILRPKTGEGGEIHLDASEECTTMSGVVVDTNGGSFRVFGIPSADGTTRTGVGATLVYDPYTKYFAIGGDHLITIGKPPVPNYGAGVAISSGYTTPSAGVVIVISEGNYSGYTSINVNGREVALHKATAQLDSSASVLVNKGDSITYRNGGTGAKAQFYPLKIGG